MFYLFVMIVTSFYPLTIIIVVRIFNIQVQWNFYFSFNCNIQLRQGKSVACDCWVYSSCRTLMASNIRCGMMTKAASYTSTWWPSCQALKGLACGQQIFLTTLTRQVESCNENECGVYYLNVTSNLHLLLWFLGTDLF